MEERTAAERYGKIMSGLSASSRALVSVIVALGTACGGSGSAARPVGYTPPHEFEMEEARGTQPSSKAKPLLVHTPTEPIPMLGALRPPEEPSEEGKDVSEGEEDASEEEEEGEEEAARAVGPNRAEIMRP